jgi:hypothetical protein
MINFEQKRVAIHSKLKQFLNVEIAQKLATVMAQMESCRLGYSFSFEISKEWEIWTSVLTKYSNLGWFQDDDTEVIKTIQFAVKIFLNEKFECESTLVYSEETGFQYLQKIIDEIIEKHKKMSIDIQPKQEHTNLSINRIMLETYNTEQTARFSDYRVEEIVTRLRTMNYSKQDAIVKAQWAIQKLPEIHDLDTLVNEILENA